MEVVGVVIAAAALVVAGLSWREAHAANRLSKESNTIAGRALGLNEEEHQHREKERDARARLTLRIEPGANHRLASDGSIATAGTTVYTTITITITNEGDRAAGRTRVDVWLPMMPIGDAHWTESAGGQEERQLAVGVPDPTVRLNLGSGSPTYESRRLSRTLDQVAIGVPELLHVRASLEVADLRVEYPVDVLVQAEGAESELRERAVVRFTRI